MLCNSGHVSIDILAKIIMGKHRLMICIFVPLIFVNATLNAFWTKFSVFKIMQRDLKADILERQLLEEKYADAERTNAKSFQLRNHNYEVVSSSDVEKRPMKKRGNIGAEFAPTTLKVENVTTHTANQINKREEPPFDNDSLNDQMDDTCHVTNHCRNRPFLDKPCSVIVPRASWGARETLSASYMKMPISTIFIHHTAMERCYTLQECETEMMEIQDLHMDTNGWDDIGYSFVVGDDGMAYEARGWDRVGAHTRGWNSISISIAVMGNFNYDLPSDAALGAIDSLISCGILTSNVLANYTLHGHRTASAAFDSPGHMFNDLIQTWPHHATLSA